MSDASAAPAPEDVPVAAEAPTLATPKTGEQAALRSIDRRRTIASRRLEDRVADDAHKRYRRIAGHGGPCTRRQSRRLQGECRDRRELADLHRRDRLHLVALYWNECARGAFCRRR